MFAVIKTGGKQYRVAANDVLKIEKLEASEGDIVTFDQVLMVGNGDDVTVGAPLVEGASVAAEFIGTKKSRTVIILKKQRRQHYDRRNGHRQLLSSVRITEILTGGATPSVAAGARKSTKTAAAAAPVEAATAPAADAPEAAPVEAKAKRTTKKAEAAAGDDAPAKKPAAKKAPKAEDETK